MKNSELRTLKNQMRRISNSNTGAYRTPISRVGANATVMRPEELRRIQRESIHLNPQQRIQKQEEDALIRKRRADQIEESRSRVQVAEKRRMNAIKRDSESENLDKRRAVREQAEAIGNEEFDEVKLLNSDMMHARVMALRERQLADKQAAARKEKEEDDKMNAMMEKERVRAVKIYEDRENAIKANKLRGAKVLEAQIEERKQRAAREAETRQKEREIMAENYRKTVEEDRRLMNEKKQRQQAFMRECDAANRMSIQIKQKEKQRELEADRMMCEYQAEQARKEAAREKQLAEQRAEREKEIDRVRKMQQKAIDTKAENDEILARRYQLQQERKDREREEAEAKRAQTMRESMRQDYEMSQRAKRARVIEAAKREKSEFDRQIEEQREAKMRARDAYIQRMKQNEAYRDDLKREIESKEEKRRIEILAKQDEQKHIEEQNLDRMEKIEQIRQMKLEQLRREGVPEKYLYDMIHRKFTTQ